jgi:signal transduction histidine kinase
MRTQIASDLHDEVGSSLSYLSFLIGSFDIKNAPEQTAAGIEKSKAVMKKTASNIRDVVWAIDARRDKAGDLLDRMEDFAYDMLSSRGLHYHLDINGIGRDLVLSPVFRQNVYLIYKEAVNNIAKHSSADRVDIALRLKDRTITLRIADNGHNQNHQKVKGQGLENMALRARRIRGELSAQPSASGFIVELQAPFG